MAKRSTAIAPENKRKPRGKPFTGKGDPRNGPGFQPGVSPNPGGRPKDRAESAAYIEQRLREEYLEQLVTALAQHAIKGSPTHIVEALNRVAGKVIDRTELNLGTTEAMDDGIKLARELLKNDAAREQLEAVARTVYGAVEAQPGDVRAEAEPGPLGE